MTATVCNAAWQSVIDRYVARSRRDAAVVVAATFNEPTIVIAELEAVSWELGLRSDTESETTKDAWWDAFETMLPFIAQALR